MKKLLVRFTFWAARQQFMDLFTKLKAKPITHQELELTDLIDKQGRRYYAFRDYGAMPVARYNKMLELFNWMANGIQPEYLDQVIDAMDESLTKGLEQEAGAAKIGALIHELQRRKEMVVPFQLQLQVLCIQFVREDEDPGEFVQRIQMDKVEAFEKETHLHDFFLERPEWRKLQSMLGITSADWIEYLRRSGKEEIERQARLAYLLEH